MKRTLYLYLLILLSVTITTSCASHNYYYSMLDTSDPYTQKNEDGDFVTYGDSIDVVFNFAGENTPVQIGVINKMNKTIYVDWHGSGIRINNRKIPFLFPTRNYEFGEDPATDDDTPSQDDGGGLMSVEAHERADQFLLNLSNFQLEKIPAEKYKKGYSILDYKEGDPNNKMYKKVKYNETNSPVNFEIYLAIYDDENQFGHPLIFKSSFYISELLNGGATPPSKIYATKQGWGDVFYFSREVNKKNRKFGNVLGTTAIITGAALVGVWLTPDIY